jgi:putative spermidine/putrescine transport system substrate-binding protein
MQRRSFLLTTGSLFMAQLLAGCAQNNQGTFNVQLLKDSIPGQVVNQFHKGLQEKVQLKFAPVEQLLDLFQRLQTWQQKPKTSDGKGWDRFISFMSSEKPPVADLVTLGDYWIKAAIEQKLIQPIDVAQLSGWKALPKRWQELVTRNDKGEVDAQGKVWAAPYRWGVTAIVYRRDRFQELGWTPKDWGDLWKSELRDRISLLDQPREVIGLVLKKLGKSYNTENLAAVKELKAELQKLKPQVKFYGSNRYLEPLLNGDTWLAVGWSSDIIPAIGRYPELAAITPQSGTAVWADSWVHPTSKNKEDLLYKWIDFCWQPDTAKEISVLTKTNSPILTNISSSEIQDSLRNLLLNNQAVFDKSEFLLPLSASAMKQYQSLFAEIKGG